MQKLYLGGLGSLILPAEGDKGIPGQEFKKVDKHLNLPLASVVDISHSTVLLELALHISLVFFHDFRFGQDLTWMSPLAMFWSIPYTKSLHPSSAITMVCALCKSSFFLNFFSN